MFWKGQNLNLDISEIKSTKKYFLKEEDIKIIDEFFENR